MVKQSGKVPQVKCRSNTFPFLFFSAWQYRQWKLLLLDCSLNKAMNKKRFMWLNPCHDNSMKSHKNWTKRNKLKVNLKKKKVNGKMSSKAERSITLCKSDVWLRSCLLLMRGFLHVGTFFCFAGSFLQFQFQHWLIQHYIPTGLWRSMGQQCNKL